MRFRHYLSQLFDTRRTRVGIQGHKTKRTRRLLLEQLEDRCVPTTFTVDTLLDTVDANPGDGLAADAGGSTSLRAAIMEANATAGNDTITLPAGTYILTIPNGPGGGENAAATGDLDITGGLTLTGAGAATTIIDAGDIDRVIDIIGVVPVTISGVTVQNGDAGTDFTGGGGIHLAFGPGTAAYTVTLTDCIVSDNTAVAGGGINNDATQNNSLVLVRTTVSNNTASRDGGGIVHGPNGAGSLTLTDCIVRDNDAGGENGGILAAAALPSDLSITGSTISGNSALGGTGGGITWFGSAFVLTNSTVSGNTAGTDGGGISTAGGNVTLTNCTISGNTAARDGGGISSLNTGSLSGPYTLTNVTITNNVADSDNNGTGNGGGIFNFSPGTISLLNTIVVGNTDGGGQAPDCSGTITSQGHNLIQSTAGCTITGDTTGNITGQDPQLGLLADNGGPTLTHLPLAGSPAIDAGTSTGAPATDQRGISRPQGAGVDIGAVEVGAAPPDDFVEPIARLQFSAPSFVVGEEGGQVVITVTRSGGIHHAVTVDFAASPGSASAGQDFTAVSGTLDFAVDETSKTFAVPILEDAAVEGDETVNLTLSNAQNGAELGTPSTAVLTIHDNDVPPSPPPAPAPPPTPQATETITVTYVSREAFFRSELGLFIIDDASGRIGNLHPGDAGYAAAALARRRVIFRRHQLPGAVTTLKIPSGSLIAFYLVQNGASSDVVRPPHRPLRKPQVFFSIAAANADHFNHVRSRTPTRFGFEDQTGGGDRDFNDLVVRITRGGSVSRKA